MQISLCWDLPECSGIQTSSARPIAVDARKILTVARAKVASSSSAAPEAPRRRDRGAAAPPGELVPEPAWELLADEPESELGAGARDIGLVAGLRRLIRKYVRLAFKRRRRAHVGRLLNLIKRRGSNVC